MFEYLYEWMKNLAFYMVLVTMAIHMIPNADYKKYISFFTGLVLVVMLCGPVLKIFGMDNHLKDLYENEDYLKQIEQMEESTKYLNEIDASAYLGEILQDSEEEQTDIEVEEIQIGQ